MNNILQKMHNITNKTVDCRHEGYLTEALSYIAYIFSIIILICCVGGCYFIPKYSSSTKNIIHPQ